MKLRSFWAVAVILISLVLGSTLVQAQWSALNSGYAVTTNYHGVDVLPGTEVTAWAGTTDSEVNEVEFRWLKPDGTLSVDPPPIVRVYVSFRTPDVPSGVPEEIIDWAEKNPSINVWYANNTQTPDILGNWTVQVFFYAPGGHLRGKESDIIRIRATSFNVIPEAPFGTIAILLAMFGALSTFTIKKKRLLPLGRPI